MTGFTKELQRALKQDAEKLTHLTGEEHEVAFFSTREDVLADEAARRYPTDTDQQRAFVAGAKYILTGE